MNIRQHLDDLKQLIINEPRIVSFHILRERSTMLDGYLRGQIVLVDHNKLEFAEYVQLSDEGNIQVITYSYHWRTPENHCIKRWDNTPHHPELPDFPHHVHIGVDEKAIPGQPMSLDKVINEIIQSLS